MTTDDQEWKAVPLSLKVLTTLEIVVVVWQLMPLLLQWPLLAPMALVETP